jgi:hypothetical protein
MYNLPAARGPPEGRTFFADVCSRRHLRAAHFIGDTGSENKAADIIAAVARLGLIGAALLANRRTNFVSKINAAIITYCNLGTNMIYDCFCSC